MLRIRAVGMFPAGVRLCPVQTGVRCLEVESFDFLCFSKEKVQQVSILRGERSSSAPGCSGEPTGTNQVCGAVGTFLGLLVSCVHVTNFTAVTVHDLNLHFIGVHVYVCVHMYMQI